MNRYDCMGFASDLAKTILITWTASWITGIIWFAGAGKTATANLLLVGLIVPSLFMVYRYWELRKIPRGS